MALKVKNENFFKGLITKIEDKTIPRGAASASLNWLTDGDKTKLRGGMRLIGAEATGSIQGTHTTTKADGTQITFIKRGQKLLYYSTVTKLWVEVGTNLFGTNAADDECFFSDYVTNAGNQMWFSTPNSSLYKLMTANPDDVTDMYDAAKNFKGLISIILNRMFLWFRNDDKSGVYGSYIDNLNSTVVSNEVIDTGDGGKAYSGTLVFKAGDAQRTCFAITANDEDSVETFTDDYNGILTGSAGGTGTINYTTGVITLTFAANVTIGKEIRASHSWEDSTNKGIADFTKSATRLAGEGFIFRQDVGGDVKNVLTYNDIQYCLHKNKAWRLNIGADDTDATNRIFREHVGLPYFRASVATGDGIFYVDDSDISDPRFRVLQLDVGSSEVIPVNFSSGLDLSPYSFDRSAIIEFGDYIVVACRTTPSTINNRMFLFNKIYRTWDFVDYFANSFAINNGALWAGDSLTGNVYELFSGVDDDNSIIGNLWEGNNDDLDIDRIKKAKRLVLQGRIQRDQSYNVYLDLDNSGYALYGTVDGTGDYVDRNPVTVGSFTLGKKIVGGGSVISAFNYKKEIKIKTDKFEKIKIKFEATKIGYVDVSMYDYKDIRIKSQRISKKYRT